MDYLHILNDHEPLIRLKYVMNKERIDFLYTTILKKTLDNSQLLTSLFQTYRYTPVATESLVLSKKHI